MPAVLFVLSLVSLWFGIIVGWIINFVWLFTTSSDVTTEFFIALVGVFVLPLGSIHGWYTLF